MEDLKKMIRDVPDFPKEGILFKDIAPLLQDKNAFRQAIDAIAAQWADKKIDVVVGIEARGFLFAAALAYKLGAGVVIIRKPGKLPYKTISFEYKLEYGTNTLEIHEDAIKPGQKVLIVDDLLATSGTTESIIRLVEKMGGEVVGVQVLIELGFLKGRDKLKKYKVKSIVEF